MSLLLRGSASAAVVGLLWGALGAAGVVLLSRFTGIALTLELLPLGGGFGLLVGSLLGLAVTALRLLSTPST